jgi:DNA modification methylase
MDNKKAELVFTDPPYRLQVEGGNNQWVGKQANKVGQAIKDIADFQPESFLKTLSFYFESKMNAYVFCNKELIPEYLSWCLSNNYSFNILVWKKPNALPIGGSHRPDLEYLLFFRKNAIWNNGLPNVNYSKLLEYQRDNSTSHPTMKPLGLIADEILISSNKHGVVVDMFGGSGSTLIACEQTQRTCYMMELDPKYCDVIIERWEKLTGQKAELLPAKAD